MGIRPTFLALFFLISTNAIATWQPYTIHPEHVDEAIAKLSPEAKTCLELQEARRLAQRSIDEEKLPLLVAKEAAKLAGSQYRKPRTYPKLAVKSDQETWKDVHQRFVTYARANWGEEADAKIASFTEEVLQVEQKFIGMCQHYQGWIDSRGVWNLDPFMRVIDSVMGISADPQEEFETDRIRQASFEVMKATGFLVTEITDLSNYNYNSGRCLASYFEKNPHANSLVIGCGHYMPKSYEICDSLQITPESICGACHEAPHEGVVTLSYKRGYQADLLADMYEECLWASIQDRLAVVEDHSGMNLGWNFEPAKLTAFLKNVHDALKPAGFLFIQGPQEEGKEKPFAQIVSSGFKYLGYDAAKQALKFGKQ